MTSKILSRALKSPLISLLRRVLPIILSLAIIAAFLRSQPQLATDMFRQVLYRFQLDSPPPYTQELGDIASAFNGIRAEKKLQPLNRDPQLDQAAKLIAMSILGSASDSDILPIDQAATAVGYSYQTITYLAGTYPLPPTSPIPEAFAQKTSDELIKKSYQQFGLFQQIQADEVLVVAILASPSEKPKVTAAPSRVVPSYTGAELWQEIQKYRREHGVPEFKQDNTLCTISSIRVNQLLELDKLDNHAGFEPLIDQFRDSNQLTYGNLAENILQGYPTATAAISGWDQSLGHQALLKSGAYVWACASANSGFAVLVAAY